MKKIKIKKEELKAVFEAPPPLRKEEFIRTHQDYENSLSLFFWKQLGFIQKSTWAVLFLLFLAAALTSRYIPSLNQKASILLVSAMMPFWIILIIKEEVKSRQHRMAELEQACRYSLIRVFLARLILLGSAELILLCAAAAFMSRHSTFGFFRLMIYLLVPFLLTSLFSLLVVRHTGKENEIWYCLTAGTLVSLLFVTGSSFCPDLYENQWMTCWIMIFGLLLLANSRELYKLTQNMEDYIWNLS